MKNARHQFPRDYDRQPQNSLTRRRISFPTVVGPSGSQSELRVGMISLLPIPNQPRVEASPVPVQIFSSG